MSGELLKKLAEELKSKRLESGITLQQIYQKTRIDVKFLESIENGDFEVLPEVYVRAFIKEYSSAINLSPDEIIQKYETAKTGKVEKPKLEIVESFTEEPEEIKPIVQFKPTEEAAKPIFKRDTNILYYGGAGIAAILFILIYFIFIYDSSEEIIVETPYEKIMEDKNSEEGNRFDLKQVSTKDLSDSLKLKIIAVDTVWVRITIDETNVKEYLLKPEQFTSAHAKTKFQLLLGNTGIELFMNDSQLKIDEVGGTRNLQIDRAGIKYLPMEKKKTVEIQKANGQSDSLKN
ncbi:MAG: helix-turn-helix domain-containing protein [Bacteroidetes bacterium]|nr:helix-turn-helix domain-containing protein [Bacteroidota bacterium]MBU1681150.1 helix-turn-helix domain-containing protein [Bacteroidota bacterium]MBU2505712.1 helix-turn-helix domain-containing protein [Bacteroidota bacterium]